MMQLLVGKSADPRQHRTFGIAVNDGDVDRDWAPSTSEPLFVIV